MGLLASAMASRRTLSALLALVVSLPPAVLFAAAPALADGTAPMADVPDALVDAAAVEVDWNVFLFGGKPCAGGCAPSNQILRYDTETGNTTVVAYLPAARSGAAAVLGPEWKIYVFGGTANGTALDDVVRFDPGTYEVRQMNATMPTGRHGAAAAWGPYDLHVLGGIDASGLLAQRLLYNVTGDVITVLNATLPEPRARMAVAQDVQTTYLLGGENVSGPTDSILVFQGWLAANGSVVEADARLPFPVSGASAAWGDQNVFVFGGLTATGATDVVSRYDPDGDRVVQMNATLPGARNATAAVYSFSPAESFYVFGGVNATGVALSEVVRYHATPDAPGNVTPSLTPTGIRINWSAPPEDTYSYLTGYQIHRGSASNNLSLLAYSTPAGNDTWHDEMVTPGTWYYALRAYSNGKVGPMSAVVNASYGRLPSAPSLAAEPLVEGVSLDWGAPADLGQPPLSEYRVYRHNATAGFVLIATVDRNQTAYVDTGLQGNQHHRYVVAAANDIGEGPASNEANATTLPRRAPSPPLNLTALPIAGGVHLSWEPPADEGTAPLYSYAIWRGRYPGERWYGFGVYAPQTTFNDTIPRGETYWYEVEASSDHGTSGPSNNVSASGLYAPTAPQSLQVASGPGMLNLSWSPPADAGSSPVSGYRVYGRNATGPLVLLMELGNLTQWTETNLPANHTRYYRVSAVNDVGEGAQSAEASNTTWDTPGAPSDLQATPGVRTVNLSWSPPTYPGGSAITSYHVYRDGGLVGVVSPTTFAFSDTGLADGTKYTYRVSAVNAAGEGPLSAAVEATTFDKPTAPRELGATKTLSGIVLGWLAPVADGGTPVTKYVVYRSLSSTADGIAIAEPTGLAYTDTGCPIGRICYYRVAAVNAVGEGPKSNQAWALG